MTTRGGAWFVALSLVLPGAAQAQPQPIAADAQALRWVAQLSLQEPRERRTDGPSLSVLDAAESTPLELPLVQVLSTALRARFAGEPLSLADAYRAALAHDARLAAARAATEARRERLPQARAQLFPNVGFSATRFLNQLERTGQGSDGRPVTLDDRYWSSTQVLSAKQPIYRPALWADVRQATALVAAAEAALQEELQVLAVRVSSAYLEAVASHDQLAMVLARKRAYSTQVDAARRRFRAGAGTRTDIDEAQARYDMAVAEEIAARETTAFARQQLQLLTGEAAVELLRVDPQRLPADAVVPADLASWIARAESASPEVRRLRAQLEAAGHGVDEARAGHLPTLDAVAQLSRGVSENVNQLYVRNRQATVGLQLNIPLFAGGYVNSQVREALAERDRAREDLEALRRDIGLRVHKEYRGATEGAQRVTAYQRAVQSATTARESALRSFEAGVRTVVDIARAEEQLAAAERTLADARYGYLLSLVRLHSLTDAADLATIDRVSGWFARP